MITSWYLMSKLHHGCIIWWLIVVLLLQVLLWLVTLRICHDWKKYAHSMECGFMFWGKTILPLPSEQPVYNLFSLVCLSSFTSHALSSLCTSMDDPEIVVSLHADIEWDRYLIYTRWLIVSPPVLAQFQTVQFQTVLLVVLAPISGCDIGPNSRLWY